VPLCLLSPMAQAVLKSTHEIETLVVGSVSLRGCIWADMGVQLRMPVTCSRESLPVEAGVLS
jgi:hypothetical protein